MSTVLEKKIDVLSRRLSTANRQLPAKELARLPESQVIIRFQIGRSRLKQLRIGTSTEPPKLFNWGHVNGRKIDYDVNELNRYFKRSFSPLS